MYVQETNPNTKVLFLGGRERLSKSYELVIPFDTGCFGNLRSFAGGLYYTNDGSFESS